MTEKDLRKLREIEDALALHKQDLKGIRESLDRREQRQKDAREGR
jgi:hypothetical protein